MTVERATVLAVAALLAFAVGCGNGKESGSTASIAPPSAAGNGEESIEAFGQEAEGTYRKALLGAFDSYLEGIAAKDYPAVCVHLTAGARRSLRRFARTQSPRPGCARLLSAFLTP